MNDRKLITIINYLFVFLTINYNLIVKYVTKIDSGNYLLILLSILVLVENGKQFNRLQLTKPIAFWLIWCFYAFINYNIRPRGINPMSVFVLYRKIFIPLIVMTVVVKEYKENPNKILWLCLITHVVYMLVGYYFDRGILFRINNEENELGNMYAINSCFTLFYLMLLNRTRKINMVWFVLVTVVIMVALAMSGTRKAFGAGFILLLFWLLSLVKLKRLGSWVIVAVFLWVGIQGYNLLMENTFMGQRMEYLEQQQEDFLPVGAPEFLKIFGDRAGHYYYGWFNFLEHPLFGIGTGQARVNQGYNSRVYTHTEFMAQLNDQGLVGFLLFAFFYSWIISHLLKQARYVKQIGLCMFGGLITILFLSLTTWTWEFPCFFICIGVLIGFCNTSNNQNFLQNKIRS